MSAELLPKDEPARLVSHDGSPVSGSEMHWPSHEVLLRAHERLVLGRRINDQAAALVRQGQLAVYPSSHGQEACQVAAAAVLEDKDWMFPTYRDTVSAIVRGVDPIEAMVLLRGEWHSGYDPFVKRVAPQATPLATQLVHAVGVAHAATLRGEDTVVMAMCGDGATSEGDFHEAVNFAAIFKAPVVFFVQNNGYAISVPLSRQSVAPSLAHKGIGYGVPGCRVDGNDVATLLSVLGGAVEAARSGAGPQLVEAHTYRIQAHTNADDDARYRSADEVSAWQGHDPLERSRAYLKSQGLLSKALETEMVEEAEMVVAAMREGLVDELDLDPKRLFDYVHAHPTSQLREQAAFLAGELARQEEPYE